ncbi:protein of unknown function [Pararobbsia alpina]
MFMANEPHPTRKKGTLSRPFIV